MNTKPESLAREIAKKVKNRLKLYVYRDDRYAGSAYSAVSAFAKEIKNEIISYGKQMAEAEREAIIKEYENGIRQIKKS